MQYGAGVAKILRELLGVLGQISNVKTMVIVRSVTHLVFMVNRPPIRSSQGADEFTSALVCTRGVGLIKFPDNNRSVGANAALCQRVISIGYC